MNGRLLLLLALSFALLLAGCAGNAGANSAPGAPAGSGAAAASGGSLAANGTFKIGLVGPFTGSLADFGPDDQDGAQMAVDEINAAGGIGGRPAELVVEDTGCDPAKAVTAFDKLVSADHISALVGGLCSGETLAMAPLFNADGNVTLSPGATSPGLSDQGGPYFFRMSPSDAFQGRMMAGYVYKQLNISSAAVLYENNTWGAGLRGVFEPSFRADGGNITGEGSFEPGASDMRAQIGKLLASNPQAVYLLCYPAECAAALAQLHEAGYAGQIVGADAMDDQKALQSVATAAEGAIWSVPAGGSQEFDSAFEAKYGHAPAAYAAQAYDAVKLLALAANSAGTSGPAMRDWLRNSTNYTGATGAVSFDSNGDRAWAAYDIKTFVGGQVKLLEHVSS